MPNLFPRSRSLPAYFDADWYLRIYKDVAASGADPVRHYRLHGRAEGRLPCFLAAMARERDLKHGMLGGGQAGFDRLLAGPDRAERAWSRIALARAAATAGDWAGAAHWLAPLDPARDIVGGFGLPDTALLAIEAAVMVGDFPRARLLLGLARRHFGRLPDLGLAHANIIAAQSGFGWRWQARIARLYLASGLAGFSVTAGDGPAFDRLRPGFLQTRILARRQDGGPLVSVVMPARNAGATIPTALASLTAQSWTNLEVLVVDNGSTDDTAAQVRKAAQQDPRIRLLDGSGVIGTYAARNLGVVAAQGAFITVLDSDDWAHPARIAQQVRALQRKPAVAASISHWARVTPDLRFTRWWGDAGHLHPDVSSLMIRAGLRDSLGYWDRARAGADSEYHRRILALHGRDAVTPVLPGLALSLGRLSTTSLTGAAATNIASQHFGPRRNYDEAGARWHKALVAQTETGAPPQDLPQPLPLPQTPERRPFAIPPALGIGDPAPLPGPEDRILQSGLFDPRWYLQTYPDLRAQRVDGAAHYLMRGAEEGRDPGPHFSSSAYVLTHDCGGQNPLLHALEHGRSTDPLPEWQGALPLDGPHHLYAGHQARPALFGAERSFLDMLARAVAAGVTPSVVLPHLMNADYLAALRPLCHRIHVIPYGWRFGAVPPAPETVALLAGLIRRIGAVELHQNTAVLSAPLAAARAAGVPAVLHVRELPAEDAQLCHEMGLPAWEWRAQLLEEADRFVANSAAVMDWLATDPARVSLIPNRVAPALFDLPPPRFAPPLRVALIGSLTRRKGLGDMLKLANAARGLPLRFVLIGPESPDLAALGPLPANLSHAGYASSPMAAITQADIVLNLSHFAESYGLTVMEAMAASRPVISYNRGTPPSLIGPDGGAGHIAPPDDPAAVLAALRRMLEDPATLPAMSRAARARARSLQG